MRFPIKGGEEWELPREKLLEYQVVYPGVDIVVELRAAKQWLLDNSTRLKTARGMPRFLSTWLKRELDRLKKWGKGAGVTPGKAITTDLPLDLTEKIEGMTLMADEFRWRAQDHRQAGRQASAAQMDAKADKLMAEVESLKHSSQSSDQEKGGSGDTNQAPKQRTLL